MKIGIPTEITTDETRVSVTSEVVSKIITPAIEVLVQANAGKGAFESDKSYVDAGARIIDDPETLFQESDMILKVQPPIENKELGVHEVNLMRKGSTLISFMQPLVNHDLVQRCLDQNITSFSMDAIPRIARAQKCDALTSMSSLSGYKAVLIAADSMGRLLPLMMTAAGTYAPAKGLILGAGVAGLQALATGRRLGAMMFGYDVRPVVKEQVQSLGATFLEAETLSDDVEDSGGYARELSEESQDRQRRMLEDRIKEMDFVITTALIPGRPAPTLITNEMVSSMRSGSVIVDIAAETGGNCEATIPGSVVEKDGVTIHGPMNIPASLPIHASNMYARNISSLLEELVVDDEINLNFDDEIVGGSCITHEGNIIHEVTRQTIKG
ncbi:Re/Si-specific NAD(P)(+) transhydrogenase subunit alpha [Dehalococcoidia bacterium]|nr:Re/Si-specific NAD(P)(+) transhydrogenase subunit alpha [Dehalococcoidia bacterium]